MGVVEGRLYLCRAADGIGSVSKAFLHAGLAYGRTPSATYLTYRGTGIILLPLGHTGVPVEWLI